MAPKLEHDGVANLLDGEGRGDRYRDVTGGYGIGDSIQRGWIDGVCASCNDALGWIGPRRDG
jgi:hypothetical protein